MVLAQERPQFALPYAMNYRFTDDRPVESDITIKVLKTKWGAQFHCSASQIQKLPAIIIKLTAHFLV